jgi:acyl carrier protein
MSDLETDLKILIIDTLELEDIEVADIATDEPLFGDDGGLGLDSIDALEIGLVLDEKYGIELDPEQESTREHFRSISSLAKLVRQFATQ